MANTNTIKIPNKYKYEYVCCLPKEIEATIMNAIRTEISTLALSDSEKADTIENANSSKVCDLTETINIQYI